jgi:hypothetical protein
MKTKRTKKQKQRLYYIIWRLKNKYSYEINKTDMEFNQKFINQYINKVK